MSPRVLAFALIAVILGAPVATVVCEAACEASDATQKATAEHHSCHGGSTPAETALTAPAHPCGHTDQLPPALDQLRTQHAALPAVVPAAAFVPLLVDVPTPVARRAESSPPTFIASIAPLRL